MCVLADKGKNMSARSSYLLAGAKSTMKNHHFIVKYIQLDGKYQSHYLYRDFMKMSVLTCEVKGW